MYFPRVSQKDITNQYCSLYKKINDAKLNCTISVKPSHIGLNISFSEALKNMEIISKQAKELNNFLRIDMENSDLTDQTFKLLKECKSITKGYRSSTSSISFQKPR